MIMQLLQYFAGGLLLVGAAFGLLAAIGILRLPDLYTRMHAASKAGTLGSGITLVAIAVVSLDVAVILRAVVGIAFLVLTAPVSAHLLARAAFLAGYEPHPMTKVNDLASTHDVENNS